MNGISIGYLAFQLGSNKISCSDFDSEFPEWNMNEVKSKTGINYIYQSNENETVEHYLLHCPNHMTCREVLFETLRKHNSLVTLINPKYTCNLLLYGDFRYHWGINKEIVKATIEFLISSKRFDQPLIQD